MDKDLLNVIANTDEYALIDKKYTYNGGFMNNDVFHPVKAFDLSATCGTKGEIEADQKWMARYNYAAQINDKQIKTLDIPKESKSNESTNN